MVESRFLVKALSAFVMCLIEPVWFIINARFYWGCSSKCSNTWPVNSLNETHGEMLKPFLFLSGWLAGCLSVSVSVLLFSLLLFYLRNAVNCHYGPRVERRQALNTESHCLLFQSIKILLPRSGRNEIVQRQEDSETIYLNLNLNCPESWQMQPLKASRQLAFVWVP